jgi:hypothetical protein
LRLGELALAAGSIAPPRLVPGDRDVDEPLEEVALPFVSGAPRRLQLLVRGEVLAAPDQLETGSQLPFPGAFYLAQPLV